MIEKQLKLLESKGTQDADNLVAALEFMLPHIKSGELSIQEAKDRYFKQAYDQHCQTAYIIQRDMPEALIKSMYDITSASVHKDLWKRFLEVRNLKEE